MGGRDRRGALVTRFGFLIDQDTCIGCHACTVACKAEHDVPLGVNRTWVKYIEKGAFPNARRFYSVLRCNHCDDAPCVTICPTTALFRRDNGIVDFDDSVCIGCKSCMNACPYDAIYINPETDTAHKCNFCAHRVEIGLEPSCVVVCPTQSIVAGDLDDPTSKISVMLARHDTKVRAPEQGTRPKLFYKGADEAALDPLRTEIAADGMIWADTRPGHPTRPRLRGRHRRNDTGQVVARTAYTTEHPAPWKGKVSAYLVTKAVSAGALMVAALAVLTGHADERDLVGLAAPLVALVFAAITGALLIADLRQPRRFALIFLRPQWGSWLVRGAFILAVYGALALLWLLGGLLDQPDLVRVVALPAALLAAGTAGYTAFLFGQCEGRDLWQTPLLLPILLAQAVAAGAGVLLVLAPAFDLAEPIVTTLLWALVGGVGALVVLLFFELSSRSSAHVELALQAMTRGRYAGRFWILGVGVGMVLPLVLAVVVLAGLDDPTNPAGAVLGALAGLAAVVGLYGYEDAFVRAGQAVPLS
jgi:Fe-S-cluster-containing dehydrogenase component/formate-dependent nitrite reductase membrane component NrfD